MGQLKSVTNNSKSQNVFEAVKSQQKVNYSNKNIESMAKYVSFEELQLQKQVYMLRLSNKNVLVCPEGFQIQSNKDNFLCNSENHIIKYYFQKTQNCIFDIRQLQVSQGLTILAQCATGFKILLTIFGNFFPQAEMIVKMNGIWKVWMSPNFTHIQKQRQKLTLVQEKSFVVKLVRIFDMLRDPKYPYFSYSKYIFQQNKNIASLEDLLKFLSESKPKTMQNKLHQVQKQKCSKLQRKKSVSLFRSKSSFFLQNQNKSLQSTQSSPFINRLQKSYQNRSHQMPFHVRGYKHSIRRQESQYLIQFDQQCKQSMTPITQSQCYSRNQQQNIQKNGQQFKLLYQNTFRDKITQRSEMELQSEVQIQLPTNLSSENLKAQNQPQNLHISQKSNLKNKQGNNSKHKRSLTQSQQSKRILKKKVKICCSQQIMSNLSTNKNIQNICQSIKERKQNSRSEQYQQILQTFKQFQLNQKQTQVEMKFKTLQNFTKSLNNKGKTVKSIRILDSQINIDQQIMRDLNLISGNGFMRKQKKNLSINATLINKKYK